MALGGSSYETGFIAPKKKPPRRKGGGLQDVILLLGLGVALLFLLVPGIRRRVAKVFATRPKQTIATEITVWANKNAGYYYCYGSRFYGHGPGSYMRQGDALTDGYQPEMGKYCKELSSTDSKDVNVRKEDGISRSGTDSSSSEFDRPAGLPAHRR